MGGPLNGSIKASKIWPGAHENLELSVSFEDLSAIRWLRNETVTNWIDSHDSKIAYHWTDHTEGDDPLDDQDTENDISCEGFSVRLNIRPKTATELKVDILVIPVKLSELTQETHQNFDHPRFPSFRMGKKGGETVKIINLETGPDFYGIGTWPFLVDTRPNPTSYPASADIKLAVACLFGAAQDTWNSVATNHVGVSKKTATMWPKPPREPTQPVPTSPGEYLSFYRI